MGADSGDISVIEPGTPRGFRRIRTIRDKLLAIGAHLMAPCPHAQHCPMSDNDWCHFSQRLERSGLHRRVKNGSLGYEDEKFSYIAVTRAAVEIPQLRILRHPQVYSGYVEFTACKADGHVYTEKVSRKEGDLYRQMKKASWGDGF